MSNNKSGTKKSKKEKRKSARFASPQIQPKPSRGTASGRSKTVRGDNADEWLDYGVDAIPPITLKSAKSKSRSKTIGHSGDTPVQDDNDSEFKLFPKAPTRTKSAKTVHAIDYHAPTDYKKKYEALNVQNHELNRQLRDYEWQINNLQRELKKSSKGDANEDPKGSSHYQRTIKHKEKEIVNLRQRLKLAINDYEKVYGYYKKQLEMFKKRQQKWLNEQRANEREVTQYVFADDIRRVKVRKKGLRIYFVDGEDVVFENIEVIGGTDYNDDDQYRNLVNKVRREEVANNNVDVIETLDDDDMIILCLNELNARIRDFKHRTDELYAAKIEERYDALPLYHIDDMFLKQLKANNANWIKLFRKKRIRVNKGALGAAFFTAQKQIKSGAQPTICVQNNVILNNLSQHNKKRKSVPYSKHLQDKVDKKIKSKNRKRMNKEAQNVETDEDLSSLRGVSIGNGWFTAQIEMSEFNQQPSVCIKNKISLQHIQKKSAKYKLKKKKVRGKTLQKRLDAKIKRNKKRRAGHSVSIAMDKGDSSEEDENGNDIYAQIKQNKKGARVSSLMSGWFCAQMNIAQDKQPTICVQNNVFLNNIERTKNRGSKKKKKKTNKLNAAKLQKKLNETTSSGLSKNTLDLSDDEDSSDMDDIGGTTSNRQHLSMWYYSDDVRRAFIASIPQISAEKQQLLLEIGVYLNRILPTSIDYSLIKHYLPMFDNVSDIMAALFDGVIIAVLVNFLDDELIDLRAINVGGRDRAYPVSREEVIENLFVIKMCICSLDLHEFPDFEIDFVDAEDDRDAFCWYNPHTFVDILLLVMMHQFRGLLNARINVLKYPQLFRLCQNRMDKKCAQKTSCKEWLHRWIVFVKNPRMCRSEGKFLSIDLGSYNSPATSGNISWDAIRILPEEKEEEEDMNSRSQFIYVWNTDRRDFSDDIGQIHSALNTTFVDSIALAKDVFRNKNYLMQLIYLSDLFVFDSRIEELSTTESRIIHDYIHRKPHVDLQLLAWINSFHIVDPADGNYQYVDKLDNDGGLADGLILLHLLDAVKPGCVEWRNIRQRNQIRHKFDKLANCNMVKQICDDSFRDVFHLVGMGGNDIVDENGKYIRSLLLQIQRHHATKLMATILFKKRAVSDEELLKWINNRLVVYQQMVVAMKKMHKNDLLHSAVTIKMKTKIASFEDRDALADAIHYCNVLSSINPKWINYQFIADEKQCKQEKFYKVQNAKYLITTLRRLGTDSIFITPKQFVQCHSSATISIATAIMTIAAKFREYDQLALFAKNLKQIKAKMHKK